MKNEDENRVKTNVDNSANENGAHGSACVSLTADKSIQSDSQLDKYGSDKINGNIRGSVSDCVAACTKEVQKRCLKEKEKRHQTHGEKEQQGSGASKNFFCAVPVFLSECDGGKRSTASTCESGKGGDDCDNRKRDADTGQCQGTNIRNPYRYKCGLQCYIVHLQSVRGQREVQFEHQFPDFFGAETTILLGLHEKTSSFLLMKRIFFCVLFVDIASIIAF